MLNVWEKKGLWEPPLSHVDNIYGILENTIATQNVPYKSEKVQFNKTATN